MQKKTVIGRLRFRTHKLYTRNNKSAKSKLPFGGLIIFYRFISAFFDLTLDQPSWRMASSMAHRR